MLGPTSKQRSMSSPGLSRRCTWITDHAQEIIFNGTNAELHEEQHIR